MAVRGSSSSLGPRSAERLKTAVLLRAVDEIRAVLTDRRGAPGRSREAASGQSHTSSPRCRRRPVAFSGDRSRSPTLRDSRKGAEVPPEGDPANRSSDGRRGAAGRACRERGRGPRSLSPGREPARLTPVLRDRKPICPDLSSSVTTRWI